MKAIPGTKIATVNHLMGDDMSELSKSGGCLCGAVRYQVTQDYLGMGQCHCTDCQKIAGGAPAHVALAPKGSVEVEGALKTFSITAKSGNVVHRKFCPECGTHLFSDPGDASPFDIVKVGSLDDPSGYAPTAVLFTSTAMPWHSIPEGAVTFEENIG